MKPKTRIRKTSQKNLDKTHQVYLVPGFFGFNKLGSINYFNRVNELLQSHLAKHSINFEIIEVETQPTSSIRQRALSLMKAVIARQGHKSAGLHFIGHSAGGLDIRLLLTPGVQIDESDYEAKIARKTKTAITLETPHYGTPLANLFTDFSGRHLIFLIGLLMNSIPARLSTLLISKALGLATKSSLLKESLVTSLSDSIFENIDLKKSNKIWRFIEAVVQDQGALIQLTPEAMDIFNAAVSDQSDIQYYSFITAAPPPKFNAQSMNLRGAYNLSNRSLYLIANLLTRRKRSNYSYPKLSPALKKRFKQRLTFEINSNTNDGLVPTLSQLWSQVRNIYVADHLDVVGQFRSDQHANSPLTWMDSGAQFSEENFQQLWKEIADLIIKVSNR